MPRNASTKSVSRTATKAPPKGAAKSSAHDVLKLLADDHKKVKKMFDEFEKMKKKGNADDDAKRMLVEKCCAELTAHAQVEEEIFYPALRDAINDTDLLDEAEVEHASAKQLITELAAMQPGDELYDAKFTVLGEYVKHHIDEEEKELFAKAKKAKVDLAELGEEVMERKQELHDELGLSPAEEGEEGKPMEKRKSVH